MKLSKSPKEYTIYKLPPESEIPTSVFKSEFYSVSKSNEELSIVCESKIEIETTDIEANWSLIKVEGQLDFSLTGILSSLANPLAQNKISIFAISTFDTDYILVKTDKLDKAIEVLVGKGFEFV